MDTTRGAFVSLAWEGESRDLQPRKKTRLFGGRPSNSRCKKTSTGTNGGDWFLHQATPQPLYTWGKDLGFFLGTFAQFGASNTTPTPHTHNCNNPKTMRRNLYQDTDRPRKPARSDLS